MRVLENEFQEFKDSVEVEGDEEQVTIRMMGEASFDVGSATLRKEFVPLLAKIGKVLSKTKGEIIFAGHTDNVPLIGGKYGSNLGIVDGTSRFSRRILAEGQRH